MRRSTAMASRGIVLRDRHTEGDTMRLGEEGERDALGLRMVAVSAKFDVKAVIHWHMEPHRVTAAMGSLVLREDEGQGFVVERIDFEPAYEEVMSGLDLMYDDIVEPFRTAGHVHEVSRHRDLGSAERAFYLAFAGNLVDQALSDLAARREARAAGPRR